MDYKRHYNLLIDRAKIRNLTGYTEKHHIIPKCMGGVDEVSNLVELTPEEHYVAHQLLVKMYPENDSLVYAVKKMTVSSKFNKRNNKQYGWLKRKYHQVCKKRIGYKNPSYGRSWYHCPNTLKNGKFFKSSIPLGWEPGRVPKLKERYCKVCNEYVDTAKINSRDVFCIKHRHTAYSENGKNKKTHFTSESSKKIYQNKKFITNGSTDKLIHIDEIIPVGWNLGRSQNKHKN